MEILRTISSYTKPQGIEYLLIGGHAANFYGINRQTGDLDLIVCFADKKFWEDLLCSLKYKANQIDDKFGRFSSDDLSSWPIDLMFVDQNTFHKLILDSNESKIGDISTRIVSAKHLLTLKLHALKINQPHRTPKDYGDVLALLESKKVLISIDELEELCKTYTRPEIFERLIQDLKWGK